MYTRLVDINDAQRDAGYECYTLVHGLKNSGCDAARTGIMTMEFSIRIFAFLGFTPAPIIVLHRLTIFFFFSEDSKNHALSTNESRFYVVMSASVSTPINIRLLRSRAGNSMLQKAVHVSKSDFPQRTNSTSNAVLLILLL